ncbi:MAG TPA: hypothetical protein DCS93_01910 [Microscillaceae bacterium]|nr:hypothetical protein [Microscillaceae bacterium]
MIKYYMTPLTLEGQEQFYRAVVVSDGTFTEEEMVQEIAELNTGLPTRSISAFIKLIFEIRDKKLKIGKNVQLGDTFYRSSILGKFETEDQTPALVKVSVNLVDSRKPLRDVKFSRVKRTDIATPELELFVDAKTEKTNSEVTVGSMGRINGSQLDFDASDAEQGIYFVDTASGTALKVAVVGENRPSQLMFMIPALTVGNQYTLEVRRRIKAGADLKTGRLADSITAIA